MCSDYLIFRSLMLTRHSRLYVWLNYTNTSYFFKPIKFQFWHHYDCSVVNILKREISARTWKLRQGRRSVRKMFIFQCSNFLPLDIPRVSEATLSVWTPDFSSKLKIRSVVPLLFHKVIEQVNDSLGCEIWQAIDYFSKNVEVG